MAASSSRPEYTKCSCPPENRDALRSRYPPAAALQSQVAQSPVRFLPKTRFELLPYDVLDPILEDVYRASNASRRLCRCSRKPDGSPWVYSAPWSTNPPPYSTIKNKSLAHRIVDTEYLRHTCSTFRAWGTRRITISRTNERLELDCTDLAHYTEWTGQPWHTVLRHLCRDFPLLTPGSVVLYLGNPGDSSNVQRVVEMLQSEPKHSMASEVVGGVSFWDAPRSFKESLKEPLLRAINEAGLVTNGYSVHQNTALDPKIVDVFEQSVVQERRKELSAFADLYSLIGDRNSELSYTQIPVVLLWSREPTICKSVAAITDCCQEIHFQQWDDMGDAHMDQYLRGLGHLFSCLRDSPEHTFFARRGLFFGRLRKKLFRSERIAWEKNIQELRMLNRVDRVQNQKLRFQVKPVQSFDAELLPSFDATAMLSMSSAVGAHLSSLEIQGGAADNVSLYTILAALSSSQGCLRSLKFLPKSPHYASYHSEPPEEDAYSTRHHCPLFGRFKFLSNVHLSCSFCPHALELSRGAVPGPRKWLISWKSFGESFIPCQVWRRKVLEGRALVVKTGKCTATEALLDGCRVAVRHSRSRMREEQNSPDHGLRQQNHSLSQEFSWKLRISLGINRSKLQSTSKLLCPFPTFFGPKSMVIVIDVQQISLDTKSYYIRSTNPLWFPLLVAT